MLRYVIDIEGTVQGVGFRPFVYRLAEELELLGFVQNCSGAVHIEVEGDQDVMAKFIALLRAKVPPLARIERLVWHEEPVRGEREFRIRESDKLVQTAVVISADVATCAACLAEVLDERDRRYGYAFNNCTNCGPRLTIVQGAPYDRASTTMAKFAMWRGLPEGV